MKSVLIIATAFGLMAAVVSAVAQEEAAAQAAPSEEQEKTIAEEKKAAALAQAKEWLALVDQQLFRRTWAQAAPFLKEHYERDNWVSSMAISVAPLGDVVSRKVRAVEYYTNMPGGPDRDYLIIRYDTEFENRPTAQESVTMMWQLKEARWRVAGYFVK